jgi:NADH-quinone oxidoreductase subunit E
MERDRLLDLIKQEQAKAGCVSEGAMAGIAEDLGIPLGEVYGVASFYHFISTEPKGRHVVRICKSVPCYLANGEMVAAAIEKELGIAPGETTRDGRFSFELTNCIGACDVAPAMLVDDEVYGGLTPQKIKEILQSYE